MVNVGARPSSNSGRLAQAGHSSVSAVFKGMMNSDLLCSSVAPKPFDPYSSLRKSPARGSEKQRLCPKLSNRVCDKYRPPSLTSGSPLQHL